MCYWKLDKRVDHHLYEKPIGKLKILIQVNRSIGDYKPMSDFYSTSQSHYYVESCTTKFYTTSDEYYQFNSTWQTERNSLLRNNAKLLNINEANQLNIQQFIEKKQNSDKPYLKQGYHYLTFPYELDDEVFPEDETFNIGILISTTLNLYMANKPIYIVSTDVEKCCVIESYLLNEDILHIPSFSHMNTPFLIFNEQADIFALIDYDLPLQIIGYKPHLNVEIEHYDRI